MYSGLSGRGLRRPVRAPRQALARLHLAAAAGLGFAVSGGAWMLSVEAEFVTPALALLLLSLIHISEPTRPY